MESGGPIAITAIQDYADRHRLGDMFVRQILDIDRAQLQAEADERDRKRG